MKKSYPIAWMLVGCAALIVATVAVAQTISGVPRPPTAGASAINSMYLWPGQEVFLHNAEDVAVQIYVDMPKSLEDHVLYHDMRSGKPRPIPTGANFCTQGPVVLSWHPKKEGAGEINRPLVRWTYMDTMFSYSRRTYRP